MNCMSSLCTHDNDNKVSSNLIIWSNPPLSFPLPSSLLKNGASPPSSGAPQPLLTAGAVCVLHVVACQPLSPVWAAPCPSGSQSSPCCWGGWSPWWPAVWRWMQSGEWAALCSGPVCLPAEDTHTHGFSVTGVSLSHLLCWCTCCLQKKKETIFSTDRQQKMKLESRPAVGKLIGPQTAPGP